MNEQTFLQLTPEQRAQWCHQATDAETTRLRMELRRMPGLALADHPAWSDAMRSAAEVHTREIHAHMNRAREDYEAAHHRKKRGKAS